MCEVGGYWRVDNLVSYKEIYSSLHQEYERIDSGFIEHVSRDTGSYYLRNFSDIKVKFVDKLVNRRKDAIALLRFFWVYQYQ